MNSLPLHSQIEALLFHVGEPMTLQSIITSFTSTEADVKEALDILAQSLTGRGIRLVQHDNTVLLATAPEMSELIQQRTKEELEKDLGKAGLETLTIVLYRGPVTRAEIDYIRGVNSTYTLRNLLIRGLVKKVANPNDRRAYQYQATIALLTHLGITSLHELPEYTAIQESITAFEHEHTTTKQEQSSTHTTSGESISTVADDQS